MNRVCRFAALGATLVALVAFLTFSPVRGGSGRAEDRPASAAERSFTEQQERHRFADRPLLTYRTPEGDLLFALQVRPTLPDPPPLPTDYLVVVDTSAGMAGGGLTEAVDVLQALANRIHQHNRGDRVAVWTANLTSRDLTRGFQAGAKVDEALRQLANEVPLGAVDLPRSLGDAVASFEAGADRRRVVIYLGDGRSVARPLDDDARAALCEAMNRRHAPFVAVPLGGAFDPVNLHALVAGTGGCAVRFRGDDTPVIVAERLRKQAAEPVLYPETFRLPAGVTVALPTRLPPLRRDTATLVVGRLAAGTAGLDYQIRGDCHGKTIQHQASLKVPAGDPENHFLAGVYEQWKERKDRPALLPAERALANAYRQQQLTVEELLAQAETALEENRLDPARRLFDQAEQVDPASARARGGRVLVDRMRAGKKTRQDVRRELQLNAAARQLVRLDVERRAAVPVEEKDAAPPPPAGADPLDDVQARRAIAGQQAALVVAETVRHAHRVGRVRPDEAYELLKRTLEAVRSNADLEAAAVSGLSASLLQAMASVQRIGDIVRRDQAEALALRVAANERVEARNAERLAQDRVRERTRIYHNLMDQAREEEAQRQAILMRDELVTRGQPVPQAVSAAYQIAQSRYHLKEVQEMRRLREDRFLATLLEVERSHLPFTDEPPVTFPSAAVIRRLTRDRFSSWAEWSKYRIERYSVASLGGDHPGRLAWMRDLMSTTIQHYGGIDDPKTTLYEALDQLQRGQLTKLPGGRDVTIEVNEKAFRFEALNDVLKTEIATPNPISAMDNVTVATVLKRILARIPVPSGATYILRPNTIEITTGQFAIAEKAVRVYPVADLVTPIPNGFNPQAVGQTAGIAGTFGGMGLPGGGLPLGAMGGMNPMLGGMGGLNPMLGGVGGLNPLLGGVGGLNPLLGGGGGLNPLLGGVGGLNPLLGGVGGLNPLLGGLPGAGLGAGLPLAGVNGGLGLGGPFGNFGYGAMGSGTQEQVLITLIRQVVGRPRDWAPQYNPITGMPLNPLDDQAAETGAQMPGQDNNLGYYPPAMALVVRAPSMVHTRGSNLVITGAAGGGAPGMAKAGAGKQGVDGSEKANKPLDPRAVWQDAVAKGVQDPGLLIATADHLAAIGRYDHAAELLKATLRQGIVVRPWVFRALAVALRQSGGSADEIERAEVSVAALEPFTAGAYLTAARALADDGKYERALAFCRQAAELEPTVPHAYAAAARYAEIARDVRAMAWAVGQLLRHDWPVDNAELRQTALERLEALARRVDRAEADELRRQVAGQRRRDLVVKLLWQGEADLDLTVQEPSGTVCSPLARQTAGGGTLLADAASGERNAEIYVAAEAFSGEYVITLERVWGRPLGNKARLQIVRHQGTPQESEQLLTVAFTSDRPEPIKVTLDGGRRTETAYVPSPAAHRTTEDDSAHLDGIDQVMNRLRAMADPEVTAVDTGIRGGVMSAGRPIDRPARATPERGGEANRVAVAFASSVELTAQAVLATERQSARLALPPVYNPAGRPRVVSPAFPGK